MQRGVPMLSLRPRLCLALLAILLGTRAAAQAPAIVTLPDTIAPPKALNLGSTSFYDGFGRTSEGWTWLQYGRFEAIDRITDATGGNAPYFKGTSIPVFSAHPRPPKAQKFFGSFFQKRTTPFFPGPTTHRLTEFSYRQASIAAP